MAIIGTHTLLYSSEPAQLRSVLRDVFGLKYVDSGDGWLIFALPPSEIAVHPTDTSAAPTDVGAHQFTFMCDQLDDTIRDLRAKGVDVMGEPTNQGWGTSVMLNLPGNCQVMLYEPRHAIAAGMGSITMPR
jgi:hypothetical protein